jgi:hypothetical protein
MSLRPEVVPFRCPSAQLPRNTSARATSRSCWIACWPFPSSSCSSSGRRRRRRAWGCRRRRCGSREIHRGASRAARRTCSRRRCPVRTASSVRDRGPSRRRVSSRDRARTASASRGRDRVRWRRGPAGPLELRVDHETAVAEHRRGKTPGGEASRHSRRRRVVALRQSRQVVVIRWRGLAQAEGSQHASLELRVVAATQRALERERGHEIAGVGVVKFVARLGQCGTIEDHADLLGR